MAHLASPFYFNRKCFNSYWLTQEIEYSLFNIKPVKILKTEINLFYKFDPCLVLGSWYDYQNTGFDFVLIFGVMVQDQDFCSVSVPGNKCTKLVIIKHAQSYYLNIWEQI